VDQLHLLGEPRAARLDLVGERIAVPRRPALHDVRDVDVLAAGSDLREHAVEELPGGADERLPLLVLVVARPLADAHQVRVVVADPVDDLRASLCEPAGYADRGLERRVGARPGGSSSAERHRSSSPARTAVGTPARGVARRTDLLMASATAFTASSSTVGWGASTSPVAREKIVSPSHIVCAGRTAAEVPSCAAIARS